MQLKLIWNEKSMSLFTLNKTGLLTKETTIVLDLYGRFNDWKKVRDEFYQMGYVSSIKSLYDKMGEIKKRITLIDPKLFSFNQLVTIAQSKLDLGIKSEIFYVYLYYTNDLFQNFVNFLMEIFDSNIENPLITRETIGHLLNNYLSHNGRLINQKTLSNWIGKAISILKEVHILIPKANNQFILNFGYPSPEIWMLFILHAIENKYEPMESRVIQPFHIKAKNYHQFIKSGTNENWLSFKNVEIKDNNITYQIKSKYQTINKWLSDLP